jgi:penicillin amidase
VNLPAGFPYQEHKLGFEWPDNARARRITEVLSATPKASIEDMQRLQNDVVSLNARRLVALLKPLSSPDRNTQAALRLLSGWGGEEGPASTAAALDEVWWSRHLGHAFKAVVLARDAADAIGALHAGVLLESLEVPAQRFGADAIRKRNEVLLASRAPASADIDTLQGLDPARWQWGKLHFSYFVHPMAPILDHAARARVNVGPLPRGGRRLYGQRIELPPGQLLAGAWTIVPDGARRRELG